MNEDSTARSLNERAITFTHSPPGISKNLESARSRHEKCQAIVAQNSNSFRKAVKGLQLEAGYVELLELFSRIGHGKIWRLGKLVIG